MSGLTEFFSKVPLWGVFLLTLTLFIGLVELGAPLARFVLRRCGEKEPDGALGALIGALLGLLAFMLAFTFGLAANRFDTRRQLVLEEANAIGTTYLRAGLMPQPQGNDVRRLLREYVDIRLNQTHIDMQGVLRKSDAAHDALWAQTKSLAAADMDSELRALFVEPLNETIDLHQSRVTIGLQYRVPTIVWIVMYLLASLSMLAVGYQTGMSGVRRLRGTPIVAAAFALVITMIADIDRPADGLISVSQQPIADVQRMMLRNSP
jgi:hypothetical protein